MVYNPDNIEPQIPNPINRYTPAAINSMLALLGCVYSLLKPRMSRTTAGDRNSIITINISSITQPLLLMKQVVPIVLFYHLCKTSSLFQME